jgi:hypothetical protein
MQVSRGVLFVGGAALLAAWLAAAADRARQPVETPAPRDASALDRADALARDIQAQAARLRARLAAAPVPRASGRNPFTFDAPPARRDHAREIGTAAAETPAAIEILEPPPLSLSGIAEEEGTGAAAGTRERIAVLAGLGDVFLARAGDTILARYEVVAVGADAAELRDLTTGRTIRLGLR